MEQISLSIIFPLPNGSFLLFVFFFSNLPIGKDGRGRTDSIDGMEEISPTTPLDPYQGIDLLPVSSFALPSNHDEHDPAMDTSEPHNFGMRNRE